jgi:hypothetical protein
MLLVDDTPRQRKKKCVCVVFVSVDFGYLRSLFSEMPVQLLVLEEVVRPVAAAGEEAGEGPEDPEAEVADELHARFCPYLAAVLSRLRSLQVRHHGPLYLNVVSGLHLFACKQQNPFHLRILSVVANLSLFSWFISMIGPLQQTAECETAARTRQLFTHAHKVLQQQVKLPGRKRCI